MSEHTLTQYQASFEDVIVGTTEYAGELTIEIRPEALKSVCQTLKDEFGYKQLVDISAVDYYTEEKRFGLMYNLVNFTDRKRLRITVRVEEDDPRVDSVIDVWQGASWREREAWDMMGIRFNDHPDHRRMFMPEDFEYFPMRKEFPLIGIPGSIELPDPAPPKEY